MRKKLIILLMLIFLFSSCTNVATFPEDWVDKESKSIKIITETLASIHNGKHLKFEQYYTLSNNSELILVINATEEFHAKYSFSFELGAGRIEIYYNSKLSSPGTIKKFFNSNLKYVNYTNGIYLYENPLVIDYGTLISSQILGSSKTIIGGVTAEDNEIVLDKNSNLLIRFINTNNSVNYINVKLSGYFIE